MSNKIIVCLFALTLNAFAVSVKLQWTAPAAPSCGPVTGYNIYRSTIPGAYILETPSANSGITPPTTPGSYIGQAAATTYTDNNVQAGVTYFYKVRAWTSAGGPCRSNYSPLSNEVQAPIPSQIIIIPAPVQQPAQVVFP